MLIYLYYFLVFIVVYEFAIDPQIEMAKQRFRLRKAESIKRKALKVIGPISIDLSVEPEKINFSRITVENKVSNRLKTEYQSVKYFEKSIAKSVFLDQGKSEHISEIIQELTISKPNLSEYGLTIEQFNLYKNQYFSEYIKIYLNRDKKNLENEEEEKRVLFKKKINSIILWIVILSLFYFGYNIIGTILSIIGIINLLLLLPESKNKKASPRDIAVHYQMRKYFYDQFVNDIREIYNEKKLTIFDSIYANSIRKRTFYENLNGHQFEHEIKRYFNDLGLEAEVTVGSNDKGVDIIIYNENGQIPVQCKNHSSKISPGHIRDFQGACIVYESTKSIFVSREGYSTSAISQGKLTNMLLLSLDDILLPIKGKLIIDYLNS